MTLRVASALFEIQTGEPSGVSRKVLWAVCLLMGLLIVWACFAKLDIVAVAPGRLVPETYVKIVQPAEAGVIGEILVDEGDTVEPDEHLPLLDPTVNKVDSEAIGRELALKRLELRRIEAELTGAAPLVKGSSEDPVLFAQVAAQLESRRQAQLGAVAQETAARERSLRELDAARELLEKLEKTLPSYEQAAEAYEDLAERQLVGALDAIERRREALERSQDVEAQRATVASLEASVGQHDQQLTQLKSAYVSDLRQAQLDATTELSRLEQQLERLKYEQQLLALRAPQDGVVKDLATTVGAVVQPGTVLLTLVPRDEPLLAEVSIENKDIGFVASGQPVRIKLSAYDFQKYGVVDGTVKAISPDSSEATNTRGGTANAGSVGGPTFRALVALRDQRLKANGSSLALAAGMQVTAEIREGQRTVLEYLLSPVQRVGSEAATER